MIKDYRKVLYIIISPVLIIILAFIGSAYLKNRKEVELVKVTKEELDSSITEHLDILQNGSYAFATEIDDSLLEIVLYDSRYKDSYEYTTVHFSAEIDGSSLLVFLTDRYATNDEYVSREELYRAIVNKDITEIRIYVNEELYSTTYI